MSRKKADAAWGAWNDQTWDDLRTQEGMGMVLLPLCPANHQDHYPDCESPGKTPAKLGVAGRTYHRTNWTGEVAAGERLDLATFRKVQDDRRRNGYGPMNIGVATGLPMEDGRVLVGVDPDGPEGLATIKGVLGADHPPTLTYKTGNGWRALYGCSPDRVAPNANDDGGHNGLAVQSTGRQVVIAPSWHHDRQVPYQRVGRLILPADLPESVYQWAFAPGPGEGGAGGPAAQRPRPAGGCCAV